MILTQLEVEGVCASVQIPTGKGKKLDSGVGGFADDTIVMGRTAQQTQHNLEVLMEVLQVAMLQLAPNKTIHMALRWEFHRHGVNKFKMWQDDEQEGSAERQKRARQRTMLSPRSAPRRRRIM